MEPNLSAQPDEAEAHDSNDSTRNPTDYLATHAHLPETSPDKSVQGQPRRQRRPPQHYNVYDMGDEYIQLHNFLLFYFEFFCCFFLCLCYAPAPLLLYSPSSTYN